MTEPNNWNKVLDYVRYRGTANENPLYTAAISLCERMARGELVERSESPGEVTANICTMCGTNKIRHAVKNTHGYAVASWRYTCLCTKQPPPAPAPAVDPVGWVDEQMQRTEVRRFYVWELLQELSTQLEHGEIDSAKWSVKQLIFAVSNPPPPEQAPAPAQDEREHAETRAAERLNIGSRQRSNFRLGFKAAYEHLTAQHRIAVKVLCEDREDYAERKSAAEYERGYAYGKKAVEEGALADEMYLRIQTEREIERLESAVETLKCTETDLNAELSRLRARVQELEQAARAVSVMATRFGGNDTGIDLYVVQTTINKLSAVAGFTHTEIEAEAQAAADGGMK